MLPFCADTRFLAACCDALEKHEAIRDERGEFIPFWYLLICVLIDARQNEAALAVLTRWTQTRIAADDGNALMMLHRYLGAYADSAPITPLCNDVVAALETLLAKLPVARLFESLGLHRPVAGEVWMLDFSLATVEPDGPFQRLPEDAFAIDISFSHLLRKGSNSQHSVKVSCSALGGTLGMDYGEGHSLLGRDMLWHEQPVIDLLNLPGHIRHIEAFYGIRFLRGAFSSFRKHGLRQRDIEARLLAWLA